MKKTDIDLTEQRRLNLESDLRILQPDREVSLPDPLDLDNAVRIGMERNLDIRIARIMAEIADEDALAEKMKQLPKADVSSTYTTQSFITDTDTDKDRFTMNLTLSWNLLDFGLSYIRARQAALKTHVQRMERLRQAQVLASEIAAAYWKANLAEDSLRKIDKMREEIRAFKEKAEELVAQKRLDPISAKAIEKKIVELAITAGNLQAEISGARIEMCRLMGISPMTSFKLKKESIDERKTILPLPESLDPEKIEMISLYNRPEFFSADLDLRIQQDEARAALISMYPSPGISFSTAYDSNSYYENNYWTTLSASVAHSLLTLPTKYYTLRSKRKSVEMVKAQRLLLTAGVIAQSHLALHDYYTKDKLYRLYEDDYIISDDLLTLSRERHELGIVSDWALTQRMLENVVSRLERDRRLIDVFNAYNTLLVTLGLDYGRWGDSLEKIIDAEIPDNMDEKDLDDFFDNRAELLHMDISNRASKKRDKNHRETDAAFAAFFSENFGYIAKNEYFYIK